MATLCKRTDGTRYIQFDGPDKRHTISLGRMPAKSARSFLTRVERLIVSRMSDQPVSDDTVKWLAAMTPAMRKRLERVGLVEQRAGDLGVTPRLHAFVTSYIESRTDFRPNTRRNFGNLRRNLVEYFSADPPIGELTPADFDAWIRWLKNAEGLAKSTIGKRVKNARQILESGVRQKLIPENPLHGIKAAQQVNRTRDHFVQREDVERILSACPDAQWQSIVALARYGGLRCPSEVLRLKWADIDWDASRMTVHATKTEGHDDKGVRVVPLFPELRPYLESVFEAAPEGTVHVITRYRSRSANLRTQLQRIMGRCGVQPWPKLFQNMRASRETELVEQFPIHVAAAWIGNTEATARRHYLQVTSQHFEDAVGGRRADRGVQRS